VPKPLVALSATTDHHRGAQRARVNQSYIHAVEQAGMIPLVLPSLADPALAERALAPVAGLVLTGGDDVAPALYDAEPHPALGPVDPRRDAWELALVDAARARGLPVLAICRGVQVVNVALGGTLVQDIPSEVDTDLAHRAAERAARTHEVAVEPGSRLAAALGTTRLSVNSLHHQSLDRVAERLRVTARAADGVIEGVETGADDPWLVLGVQWHPEELVDTPEPWDRRLFAAYAARL
jgi:putative glutamine amidotransferase